MRVFNTIVLALMCSLMIVPTTGCTVSQAKVNNVVTVISNWTPVLASDTEALLTDIAGFEPQDAAQINAAVNTIGATAPLLTAACKQYLAAPSPTLLAQIAAFVTTLATSDSTALLAVAQIKDAQSQSTARAVLTTIALGITIASGLLQTINVTPTATTALEQMKPYLNRNDLNEALESAKAQGLVDRSVSLVMVGY